MERAAIPSRMLSCKRHGVFPCRLCGRFAVQKLVLACRLHGASGLSRDAPCCRWNATRSTTRHTRGTRSARAHYACRRWALILVFVTFARSHENAGGAHTSRGSTAPATGTHLLASERKAIRHTLTRCTAFWWWRYRGCCRLGRLQRTRVSIWGPSIRRRDGMVRRHRWRCLNRPRLPINAQSGWRWWRCVFFPRRCWHSGNVVQTRFPGPLGSSGRRCLTRALHLSHSWCGTSCGCPRPSDRWAAPCQ